MKHYLRKIWGRKHAYLFILAVVALCLYQYQVTYGFATLFTTSLERRNIIMLETSGSSSLNPRQACAVESGARQNPNMDVVVYMTTSNVDVNDDHMTGLSSIPNVKFVQVDLDQQFRGSLLESWYVKKRWQRSRFKIIHLSDAMRLLLLYQKGGIYIDLDVVVMKSLDDLWNCTGLMGREVNNAVMAFDKGHVLLKLCLEEFAAHYSEKTWSHNGPVLLSKVLKRVCGGITNMSEVSKHRCHGVTVLPEKAFYPLTGTQWKDFFAAKDPDKVINNWKDSYLIHIWNRQSSGTKVAIGSKQPYEIAARTYCPATYKLCSKDGVI